MVAPPRRGLDRQHDTRLRRHPAGHAVVASAVRPSTSLPDGRTAADRAHRARSLDHWLATFVNVLVPASRRCEDRVPDRHRSSLVVQDGVAALALDDARRTRRMLVGGRDLTGQIVAWPAPPRRRSRLAVRVRVLQSRKPQSAQVIAVDRTTPIVKPASQIRSAVGV